MKSYLKPEYKTYRSIRNNFKAPFPTTSPRNHSIKCASLLSLEIEIVPSASLNPAIKSGLSCSSVCPNVVSLLIFYQYEYYFTLLYFDMLSHNLLRRVHFLVQNDYKEI